MLIPLDDRASDLGAEIGVFGGSGFYDFLSDATDVDVATPYGPSAAPVAVGTLGGRRIAFLARHDRALASGMSTYLDPASNWIVFTADYLAERGYCCSARCRNCPWVAARFDA